MMPGFTSGGGKKAPVKNKDGLLPTKRAGSVTRAGGKAPSASTATGGVDFNSAHMDSSMSGSDGPNKGPSFGGKTKFGASAMSQAVRKRVKSSYP